ncbi:TPA: AlpA family phage regulatory protein [Pseudomonas aeruginosa]|uniref:helix-turn-helix transcriptional regulator n=1 Tax=Pseudomonas aeruginosa TaxID=287 RepID=UPI0008FB530D|nr:AlpA family phage regulatory protein [Pseudomonas aeruginosa]KAA5600495.1 AlpA family phage regulatory protein [Pseudomonas aeruginosa]MCO3001703.1 AlpA family phage regulatory protein [Pseudomonas aeruginosa]OPD85841.1 AlpA family transcriptional regulator [Pseudomonas aeruginosa]HBO9330744.1 AlpA family phage regulatory protein [Pseudomonas aeruginosa]HEH8671951.1 AlpA family phage regulatory protein [Pseudomonas aeruginosa]
MARILSSSQPNSRFIKRYLVEEITGLSCSEIYRRIAAGAFPRQITLGPKSVVWIEAEVQAWCEARIAESRGEAAW